MLRLAILGAAGLAIASPGAAAAAGDEAFAQCKMRLETRARDNGVSAGTVAELFANIEELPRVIANDRAQPEFTQTFTEYYQRRVTDKRVRDGRRLLNEHRELLRTVSDQTGVPPQYLVALWGLETNFGGYFGTLWIPSALATLACDQRRPAFFERELMAVLTIVDRGDVQSAQLTGSWAGAIGHMQFMPTTFLKHAVDANGDGRRDLVGSLEDALTSGGRYLSSLGWQRGYRWGREVLLPVDFDYAESGYEHWRQLTHWRRLGVTDAYGHKLPDGDIEAALLLPTGHRGPAFIVYANFRAIMGWNRSQSYALSVGRLADRISGAGRLVRPLPPVESVRVATADVLALQRRLSTLGYEPGRADGLLGPATRRAIRAFQQSSGLVADGYPDAPTLQKLLAD